MVQGLVNALSDPVATAHPYPLARAGWGLFDDRPSMNVDVRWRGDAAPKDSIRFGGMENQSSCEAGNGYAAQQETAHLSDPGETLNLADATRGLGLSQQPRFQMDMSLCARRDAPRFHVRIR